MLELENEKPESSTCVNPVNLRRIIGFTGKVCPDIKFWKEIVFFVSGKMIIGTKVN